MYANPTFRSNRSRQCCLGYTLIPWDIYGKVALSLVHVWHVESEVVSIRFTLIHAHIFSISLDRIDVSCDNGLGNSRGI